jgi:hypothetical protein
LPYGDIDIVFAAHLKCRRNCVYKLFDEIFSVKRGYNSLNNSSIKMMGKYANLHMTINKF